MSERRPAEPADLQSFAGTWDAFDFSDLIAKDQRWQVLADNSYETIEGYEDDEREALALDFINQPEYPRHILGYLHYRSIWTHWPSISSIYYRLTPYEYDEPPTTVKDAVWTQTKPLIDEGLVEGGRTSMYILPKA